MDEFRKENNANTLLSNTTIQAKSFSKEKKEYYRNVLKYLDEHLYFTYLKLSDPLYGMNFSTQLPYYLQVNVGISVATIIYNRKYPDHKDISPVLLYEIEQNLKKGIFT